MYLDRLSAAVERTTARATGKAKLECKHFFSGAALYADGRICASLTPVGFAVKLRESDRTALLAARRAKPLRYFESGPIKKEYVILRSVIADDPRSLGHWLSKSIAYVASLDGRPHWSPDGKSIVFMSDRDCALQQKGKWNMNCNEIYVMRADGSGLRRLTRNDTHDGHPAW